ncbi:hypothetical protein TIFTF001_040746 [Ficus carica]|uniref:Uncharacterized protein n=1 Tax=Ficus carica TaxID=3494 RepID=A0AA87YXW9_FICCA|nr:hypothetical protein TIFTF001_040725 [Ficus carica]GMN25567.1 hypothetical protein TIFTF001_040735 [Ficus carica]GMN25597.1 hypothetical protein TIFTF001_040742 [Ficus carica]GMN25607.1 hypothetical protein TIFTF001_040746 [Ficus carica]
MVDIADVDKTATTTSMIETTLLQLTQRERHKNSNNLDIILLQVHDTISYLWVFNTTQLRGHEFLPEQLSTEHSLHAIQSAPLYAITSFVPSGTVQPQPLLGTPPTEAFNMRQAITNMVSNQVKTMERLVLQAIECPTTYEDLLEDVERPPFAQAIPTPPCQSYSAL